MSHRCAAADCPKQIDTALLMCRAHWYMVPKDIRQRVWATFNRGLHLEPNSAYDVAVGAAVAAVAEREQRGRGR